MIAKETREALDYLQSQISAAEQLLRKTPGSQSDECAVPLADKTYLEFDSRTKKIIIVEYFDNNQQMIRRLDEFTTLERIELARLIPDLIQLAKQCEPAVAKSANDTASLIEQAIAMEGES